MKRNSKFLIVAVPLALILLGLTIYEYGYLKIQSEKAAWDEKMIERKKVLRKYQQIIAAKPQLEAKLATLTENRQTETAKIIEGQTPAVAAAALQNTVKGMITLRGGTISSERIEKPEELGKFIVITVALDGLLPDIRALKDVLYALETQIPSVVIRELDASIRNNQQPKELTMRLKLSALTGGK